MASMITPSQRARDAAIALLGYKTWEDVTDYRITGAERRRVELFINAFAAFEQALLAEHGDVLPCDVKLPPATTIRAGCDFATLRFALSVEGRPKHFEERAEDIPNG